MRVRDISQQLHFLRPSQFHMYMSSSSLDFKKAEQAEAKATNLEILPSSRMSIAMKKRSSRPPSPSVVQLLEQSKRRSSSSGALGRKVKTLKELIPNSHECIGVDGLFRETADYILTLQLKVRVMQTMIDLLSDSGTR